MSFGDSIFEFFHPFFENIGFPYKWHNLFVMYILQIVKYEKE